MQFPALKQASLTSELFEEPNHLNSGEAVAGENEVLGITQYSPQKPLLNDLSVQQSLTTRAEVQHKQSSGEIMEKPTTPAESGVEEEIDGQNPDELENSLVSLFTQDPDCEDNCGSEASCDASPEKKNYHENDSALGPAYIVGGTPTELTRKLSVSLDSAKPVKE